MTFAGNRTIIKGVSIADRLTKRGYIMTLYVILAIVVIVLIIALIFLRKNSGNSVSTAKLDAAYPHKTKIYIDGMSCEHCSSRVEAAFLEKGNGGAIVNLEEKYVEIWSENPLPQAEASETIQNLGFIPVKIMIEK